MTTAGSEKINDWGTQDKRARHARAVRTCLHIGFDGTRFLARVPPQNLTLCWSRIFPVLYTLGYAAV